MNINDLRSALSPTPSAFVGIPAHVTAFAAFMIAGERNRLARQLDESSSLSDEERTYEVVAGTGYAVAAGKASPDMIAQFKSDVAQLGGRKFFTRGRAPRFEIDGTALLGIALGLRAIDAASDDKAWLIALLGETEKRVKSDNWSSGLVSAATAALTDQDWSKVNSNLLRVAIPASLGLEVEHEIRQQVWARLLDDSTGDLARISAKRAVFDNAASVLAALPVHGATVSELVTLLRGVPRALSRWTFEEKAKTRRGIARQWDIDNEYHVQNLLWAILAPIFPDLVDEQYLPSVGHRTPRYDLGIPSLKTIIEVKFMRQAGAAACSAVTEEVAADASLYLKTDQRYDRIIAFIWDDARQTEEHPKLVEGLKSMEGIEEAIIVSRPARMNRERHEGISTGGGK
jgi:hypothetical protein